MVKNKNSIGIMQGRLTEPNCGCIQFFPFDNWQNEFRIAQKLGLDEIEFIFDYYKYEQNPIWSERGRKQILTLVQKTGVKINSVCADYFMRKPFFRVSKETQEFNLIILKKLIKFSSEIGSKLIEIPLVDNSSIKTVEEQTVFVNLIKNCIPEIEEYGVKLGLEVDLPPMEFVSLLRNINHSMVGANYDSGNSSSLGYDPENEMRIFGNHLLNVHIKDRLYKGTTVSLGTGDAQFEKLFSFLHKLDYKGSFILQAARGEDGEEIKTIDTQVKFIKSLWI